MDTPELHNLPVEEKLRLVFDLWDGIATSNEPITVSDGVKTEIERRCAEYDADTTIAIDEDEMWRRVNEK